VRKAEENPTWGYTRVQGVLKNVGHRVGRSTIQRVLKAAGLPPVPQRPTSWQTFLRAHWGAIAGADFFGDGSVDVARIGDLLHGVCHRFRRVQVLGSTPHPTELFMGQRVRLVTAADDGVLVGHRVPSAIGIEHGAARCDNSLAMLASARDAAGRVSRRSRLGGLLNYYERAA
jgi:putative transposase